MNSCDIALKFNCMIVYKYLEWFKLIYQGCTLQKGFSIQYIYISYRLSLLAHTAK